MTLASQKLLKKQNFMSNSAPRSWLLPFSIGHFANDIAPVSLVVLAPAIALRWIYPQQRLACCWLYKAGALPLASAAGLVTDAALNRGRLLMITFWWVVVGYWLASCSALGSSVMLAFGGSGDAAWHP